MNLAEISPRIAEHVKSFLSENRFDSVGLYYPIRNEINLCSVLMDLKKKWDCPDSCFAADKKLGDAICCVGIK